MSLELPIDTWIGSPAGPDNITTLLRAVGVATDAAGVALLATGESGRPRLIQALPGIAAAMLDTLDGAVADLGTASTPFWLQSPSGEMIMVARIDSVGSERLILALGFGKLGSDLKAAADSSCRRVIPVLAAGLGLCRAFERRDRCHRASDSALHAINVGIVVLRRDGTILFRNQAAGRLLELRQGVQQIHGLFKAEHLGDGIHFHAALAHSSGGGAGHAALLSFRRHAQPPLIASLIGPTEDTSLQSEAAAILYIVDPAAEAISGVPALCRLHGLSAVETELVCHLVRGDVIAEAARKMRIKELTARSYLKQIFIKTGTRRQTQLVIQMLSSLIPLAETVAH